MLASTTAKPAAPTVKVPGNPFGTSTQPTVPNPQSANDYYTSVLNNDGLLKQTLAGLSASGVADQAQLRAGLQKGVIGYGAVPQAALAAPGVSDAIDQTTRDLASQNTQAGLSTAAKLKAAYDQAAQAHVASEAARGMLRSGAYGQHAAEDLLGYNQAQDSATSQLLDYLNGLYQGYLSQQSQLQSQAYGAQNDATNRVINEIANGQLSYSPTLANPAYYTPQQLATIGAPASGASPFSDPDTATLAHYFGPAAPSRARGAGGPLRAV